MPHLVAFIALLSAPAMANASCESIAKRAGTVSQEQIAGTFTELAGCDAKLAEDRFADFMRASKDTDTLVALSLAAIDANVHTPVGGLLESLSGEMLSARDQVAKDVGAGCAEHPLVVNFLKSAHAQLGDRQFGMWREAFRSCESADLDAWLAETVGSPPSVTYDEKFNVVSEALVKRQRGDALPTLQAAAIAAGKGGGPFTTILDRMNESVRPDTFGADIPDDDRQKLEKALVGVAKKMGPEQAKLVADRLYQAGAETAAASLLPVVYADRVQGKNTLMYGVAAVESCDKQAVVHFATVTDPGKRWSVVADASAPARSFKAKLKCEAEGEWPVLTTPEPLGGKGDLSDWVAGIEGEWAGKGVSVKVKEEKAIALD